jgi:hypothetical protein
MTVAEAKGQLPKIIADVHGGELVVLKDGDKEVTLYPGAALDIEDDSPELEAELLKAANGPFHPYSPDELQKISRRIIAEHCQK